MRVCIGACIGGVKHARFRVFLTPNEWEKPCVYLYMYMYIYIHIHIYIFIHTYKEEHICVYISIYTYMRGPSFGNHP